MEFVEIHFSKIKCRSTGGYIYKSIGKSQRLKALFNQFSFFLNSAFSGLSARLKV
jgi:hypothetical protein